MQEAKEISFLSVIPQGGSGPHEFVRKSAIQLFVSTRGTPLGVIILIEAGAPPNESDCFERSKSDSMMCPV